MVLDSLKGVAVLKSVRLMWQSTISIDKNFLVTVRQAKLIRCIHKRLNNLFSVFLHILYVQTFYLGKNGRV